MSGVSTMLSSTMTLTSLTLASHVTLAMAHPGHPGVETATRHAAAHGAAWLLLLVPVVLGLGWAYLPRLRVGQPRER